MNHKFPIRTVWLALAFAAGAQLCVLRAQRLPKRIDSRAKTILRGSRNPRIDTLVSNGPVEDTMRIPGMTFRFQPTYAQSVELERLLDDQQNPASPLYHVWLTPEEYGRRFGLSSDDFTKVADWIVGQGFQIDAVAKSRTYLSFSGTAAQVRDTFGTELHGYILNGKTHFANVREIAIPTDLEPLVYALEGLDDFQEPRGVRYQPRANSASGRHAVTPGDLAVIYNVAPLYRKGIDGAGQKIVVTGQSALNMQDVRDFRSAAGLPPSEPKVLLMPGGKDPGFTDALGEALLDVQYAGGAAPGATIIYVYGTNANLAAQYATDQNLGPIISHSFGKCEKRESAWAWFRNLAQQAAAQGITWVVASGDTGPAACESQMRDSSGASGISVNLPASVPEVTAIGGTTFVEGTGTYWSSTTQDDGTSALSYIPEKAWNDSGLETLLSASGGGASAAYPRPAWQTGAGVPNDNARHVPDIAFTASAIHDPYLIIMTGDVVETGGTSAGTPFFAGVLALLNQYVVTNGIAARPGLGNINPRLYQLAQTTRGVFHDIIVGNNIVPCNVGTPDCTKGQYGYSAGPGYDQVTGLGSIDVASLFENWSVSKPTPKTASVAVPSVEPSPVYQQAPDPDGFSWFYTVRVSETGGAPTTITAFSIDGYDLSEFIIDWFGSTNLPPNGSLSTDLRSKDLDVPSEHVFAFAGVDKTGQKWTKQVSVPFRGAEPGHQKGAAMSLTSDPAVVMKIGKGDPNCAPDHPYGQQLNLQELNGAAVKLTKFLAGGFDYTDRIASWFGSQTLPASGTLHARLCWQLTSVPVTLAYEIDGVDGLGRPVQATLKVDFKNLLDQKSGGAVPDRMTALSAWPARASVDTSIVPGAESQRRARSPKQTPTGMAVAPRPVVGAASTPLRSQPSASTGQN
jgi:hypothetical protein